MKRLFLAILIAGALVAQREAAPPVQPELIGEGTVSTPDDEFGGSFTADGKTLYFDKSAPTHYLYTLCVSHLVGGKWSAPEILPFSGQYRDSDPVLSPDERHLLFVSDRPINGKDEHNFDIYISSKSGNGWSAPRNIGAPVNSGSKEEFASMASNGTIYFTSDRPGSKSFDVYRSRLENGKYQEPENLGDNVNGPGLYTIEAFIAPDESYLLLGSFGGEGSYGNSDIYICLNESGVWTKPKNLGPVVNTSAREYSPRVTPDGKYLIFTSEKGFANEKRSKPVTYQEFRSGVASTMNGYGNLYRYPMEAVLRAARQ